MEFHPFIRFLLENGLPIQTVGLLLMVPIIVTLVAFFRQVVGIKAFGIYTPSIFTFALLAFDPNGLKYGVAIFLSILFVGMATRYLLRQFRLLYLPRVAITLSTVSLAVVGILLFGVYTNRTGLATVSIFPLLIMITLTEKFVATQIEKGTRTALILAGETLLISIIGYFLLSWDALIVTLLIHPWLILGTYVVNFILGRWSGLRLTEYFRFRKILRYL